MGIEIDVLNADAAWKLAAPLYEAVWPPHVLAALPWGDVLFAHADLRVLLSNEADEVVCHVGIYRRAVTWNGRKLHVGGIGGVSTRQDCRRRGYATLAIEAAIHTIRANEAVRFAILFCEPHNFAFYQARNWHPFTGEVFVEQPEGRIRFDHMAPFVFDIGRAPRQGTIDLCGLPW